MIGGGPFFSSLTTVKKRVPIVEGDIMYQDHLTCILKPRSRRHVIVSPS